MAVSIYKGNPFLTYRIMFLWAWPLFTIVLSPFVLYYENGLMIVIAIVIYILLILSNTKYTYYFCIAKDEVQIRNHLIFWYKKSYSFKEINSIRIDTNPRKYTRSTNPTFLRIYTSAVDYKTFYACTIRDKTWRALQKELSERNIRYISYVPNIEIKFSDML